MPNVKSKTYSEVKRSHSFHGLTGTTFYLKWENLRTRVSNPNHRAYKFYGGKGVKCLWSSFEEFKNDMYESYLEHCKKFGEKETQIDRIDTNGHYCKENCRWVIRKEQDNNKVDTIYIDVAGQKISFTLLCNAFGIFDDPGIRHLRYCLEIREDKFLEDLVSVSHRSKVQGCLVELEGMKTKGACHCKTHPEHNCGITSNETLTESIEVVKKHLL